MNRTAWTRTAVAMGVALVSMLASAAPAAAQVLKAEVGVDGMT